MLFLSGCVCDLKLKAELVCGGAIPGMGVASGAGACYGVVSPAVPAMVE